MFQRNYMTVCILAAMSNSIYENVPLSVSYFVSPVPKFKDSTFKVEWNKSCIFYAKLPKFSFWFPYILTVAAFSDTNSDNRLPP